jgi:hypothetical protein
MVLAQVRPLIAGERATATVRQKSGTIGALPAALVTFLICVRSGIGR